MLTLLAGCSINTQPVKKITDLSRSSDPPYVCGMVSTKAFRQSTGIATPLNTHWDGPQTDNGLCLVITEGQRPPLGLDWSYNSPERMVALQEKKYREDRPTPLPEDLGRGFAVAMPPGPGVLRPNFVVALFRCGKPVWMSIDFAEFTTGRDGVSDMIGFMKEAQDQFAKIHQCKLKVPGYKQGEKPKKQRLA
jgi:hypothetical protein